MVYVCLGGLLDVYHVVLGLFACVTWDHLDALLFCCVGHFAIGLIVLFGWVGCLVWVICVISCLTAFFCCLV